MKTLSLFVLVAIVFAAGYWIGNSASVHAQGKGMVYELRTYFYCVINNKTVV